MRLHEIERRILATVGTAVVLIVLLVVAGWTWAVLGAEEEWLPAGLLALVLLLAVVILVSSWPVLHVGFAAVRAGGSRPRRPRAWIAVFVVAVVVWGGVLIWPLLFMAIGVFWVVVVLLALLAARRLALAAVRRARG